MPDNVKHNLQLVHFNILQLDGFIADHPYNLEGRFIWKKITCSFSLSTLNTTVSIHLLIDSRDSFRVELLDWIRLLPNIRYLYVDVIEMTHWFTIVEDNQYLRSLLLHMERICVVCSSIINATMSQEIVQPLLRFLIDQNRFPRLRCIRFNGCKNISGAWLNINEWLDFFLIHIAAHQLQCIRFDFIEKEQEVTDLLSGDGRFTTTDPLCVYDIHRFVHSNHAALWIDRK